MSAAGDLAAFITARLDEDEAAALANIGPRGLGDDERGAGPWWPDYQTYGSGDLAAANEYIQRFRPLRVLREVEAKRAILADHQPLAADWVAPGGPWCTTCGDAEQYSGHDYPCPTVRHLAAVWSAHPDYREEWKP